MLRPCFLVVDRETSTGISTRKLILETAKFNVITAYSSREAIETLRKYPALDGVVTDSGMVDMPCDKMLAELQAINPNIPRVVVETPSGTSCELQLSWRAFSPPPYALWAPPQPRQRNRGST